MAPVTFPMMVAVVYLSAKLGQVTGRGLFDVIRIYYPRWFLYLVLTGNTIEAGADIGGMASAINIFAPWPGAWTIVAVGLAVLALQIRAPYQLIRNIFRWLALILLAYVGSAILARPDLLSVIKGTLIPTIRFDREFLSLLVAMIGTTLSAYLYTWQSNEEVEEKIALGRRRLSERRGVSNAELRHSKWDIVLGMFFSNVVMYFIILSTAATLFRAGKTHIENAAQAAEVLRPLAGNAAGILFALGVIGVGFLAVPVTTTGVAYDLCQSLEWENGLYRKPAEAKKFYAAISIFTLIAIGMNFIGVNPMRALVWAGIVQGFSTPPLMLLIMIMTNNEKIMGRRVNGRGINILGGVTTAAVFAATAGLVVTWLI
jgi:Mn2+/Fe2+ NRAMP family transporter